MASLQINPKLLRECLLTAPDTHLFASIMVSLEDDNEAKRAITTGLGHIMTDTNMKGGTPTDAIRKLCYVMLERGITYAIRQMEVDKNKNVIEVRS